MKKENLILLTNLYPLPWEPNRATFNKQQFDCISNDVNLSILIPVPFLDWFKNRHKIEQTSKIRYVPYFYFPKFGRRFYSVFMLLSLLIHSGLWLKNKQADLLLASWAFPEGVAGHWLSKLLRCKLFIKVHGSDINMHAKNPARACQIKKAANNSEGIISVSKALADELVKIGVNENKIKVIYNGVNHETFKDNLPKTFEGDYLLYVGNLKQSKGVMELLEGFALISPAHSALQLVFAGNGPMLNELKTKAIDLKISEKVKFLGTVNHSELPSIIGNAKLLVLPSYNEGVPNVVLEAMACGTPSVATDVGGIPEIIISGVNGILIKHPESLYVKSALEEALSIDWDKEAIIQSSNKFCWKNNRTQLLETLGIISSAS